MTPEQMYAAIANAERGVGLLWATTGAGLITGAFVKRALPLPKWPAQLNTMSTRLSIHIATPRLAVVMLIALVVRVLLITRVPWYDEQFTLNVATVPMRDLFTVIRADVHPPLFYGVEWAIAQLFGDSLIVMRLLPLAAGVLTVPIVYRLAAALGLSERSSIFAALCVALLPAHIHYSTELRAYSLLAYLILYSLLAFITRRRWTFAILLALIPLTHNLGYFYAGGYGLLALVWHGRRWIRPLIYAAIVPALWLPVMLAQSGDVSDGFWLQPLTVGGFTQGYIDMVAYKMPPAFIPFVYTGLMSVSLLSVWEARRLLSLRWAVVAGVAFSIPLSIAVASVLWRPIFLPRAMLGSVMCFVLFWAWWANSDKKRAAILGLLALGTLGQYGLTPPDVSASIAQCAGRPIFAVDIPAAMFARRLNVPVSLWSGANNLNQTLPSDAKEAFGFHELAAPGRAGCSIAFDTPLTTPEQRAFVAGLSGEQARIDFNPYLSVVVVKHE